MPVLLPPPFPVFSVRGSNAENYITTAYIMHAASQGERCLRPIELTIV